MSGRHAAPRTARAIPGRAAAARAVSAGMLAVILGVTPAASAPFSRPAGHTAAAPRALAVQTYSAPATYSLPVPIRDAFRVISAR